MRWLALLVVISLFVVGCTPVITDTEPLVPTEIEENTTISEPVQEIEEEIVPEEPVVVEEPKVVNHEILITNDGFSTKKLTIKQGESVTWKNQRTDRPTDTIIVGVRNCHEVKSKQFGPHESFTFVFDEIKTCTIVDGVYSQEDPVEIVVQ